MENELDYNSFDNLNRQHFNEMGRGYSGDVQRATLSKNMRVTERKLSRLLAGASMYDDSDSSRGKGIRLLNATHNLSNSCTNNPVTAGNYNFSYNFKVL